LGTLMSNVIGTAHVLEAARMVETVRAIVLITTDKVYENHEWIYPYREIDPLGGHDPYSASKAASELVAASYRASFFGEGKNHRARVATARAGNVIGGGDWAVDRLVPDCLRAFRVGKAVQLRFPDAVRPWQHVLEPIAGYMVLAEMLCGADGGKYAEAWNFGPSLSDNATVGKVAVAVAQLYGVEARVEFAATSENLHEAGLLQLDSSRARGLLHWNPRWALQRALEQTVAWHKAWVAGDDMAEFSLHQISSYQNSDPL